MKVTIALNYGKDVYHTRDCTGLNAVTDTETRELEELPDSYTKCTVCEDGPGAYGDQDWDFQRAVRNANMEDIDALK